MVLILDCFIALCRRSLLLLVLLVLVRDERFVNHDIAALVKAVFIRLVFRRSINET